MNGYSIRPLSSQKRTKTVARTQATATWVTRSPSQVSKVAAVRSADLRGAPLDLEPVAGQAGRLQVGLEEGYLLLQCLRGSITRPSGPSASPLSGRSSPGTYSCSASPGITLTVTRSSCGGACGSSIGQSSQRPSRGFVRVPGRHRELREQLDAARVPGERAWRRAAERYRCCRRHGCAPRGGSRSRARSWAKPFAAVGEASGESAARTVSQWGRPSLGDDRAEDADELGGDVDGGDAVERGNRVADARPRRGSGP